MRRIFIETVKRSDDSTEIFCTYNSKHELDSDLKALCAENEIVLLDIAEVGIDQHVRQKKIDRLYLGLVQRYDRLQLDNQVEVVLVCHDIRNLEVFPNRKALWYLSDVSSFRNRVQLYVKWVFLELFLKLRVQRLRKTYENMLELIRRETTTVVTDSTHTKFMMLSEFPDIEERQIKLHWAPEIKYSV